MEVTAGALTFLAVLHHVMSAGVRVKAPLGGTASVHCSYSRGSETYPKYFSKARSGEKTLIVRVGKQSTAWSRDGRISLKDDREKREFTVSIRNLTVEDAGPYWCGVDQWWSDELTEVNLDVTQNTETTQNASLHLTTSAPFTVRELHHSLAQDQIYHTDESVYLGASLAAVVLLCGITSAILAWLKNTKRAAASAQRGIYPGPGGENNVYNEIFPTNTPSASGPYDLPAPSQAIPIPQPPDEPRSTHPPLKPFMRSQVPHPESVVYSLVGLQNAPPDFPPTPFTSEQSASMHYATVQTSHMVSDSSVFIEKSCDLYTPVKRH